MTDERVTRKITSEDPQVTSEPVPARPDHVPSDAFGCTAGWFRISRTLREISLLDKHALASTYQGEFWAPGFPDPQPVFLKKFVASTAPDDVKRQAWQAETTKLTHLNAHGVLERGHGWPRLVANWSIATDGGEELWLAEVWENAATAAELMNLGNSNGLPGVPVQYLRPAISEWVAGYHAMHTCPEGPVLHCDPSLGNLMFDVAGFDQNGAARGFLVDFEQSRFLNENRFIDRATHEFMRTATLRDLTHFQKVVWNESDELYGFAAVLFQMTTGESSKDDHGLGLVEQLRPDLGPVFSTLIDSVLREPDKPNWSMTEFGSYLEAALPKHDETDADTIERILDAALSGTLPSRMGDEAVTWALDVQSPPVWVAAAKFCDGMLKRVSSTQRWASPTHKARTSARYRQDRDLFLMRVTTTKNQGLVFDDPDIRGMMRPNAKGILNACDGRMQRRTVEKTLIRWGVLPNRRYQRQNFFSGAWLTSYYSAMEDDRRSGSGITGNIGIHMNLPDGTFRTVMWTIRDGEITDTSGGVRPIKDDCDVVIEGNPWTVWEFLARRRSTFEGVDLEHNPLLKVIADSRPEQIVTESMTKPKSIPVNEPPGSDEPDPSSRNSRSVVNRVLASFRVDAEEEERVQAKHEERRAAAAHKATARATERAEKKAEKAAVAAAAKARREREAAVRAEGRAERRVERQQHANEQLKKVSRDARKAVCYTGNAIYYMVTGATIIILIAGLVFTSVDVLPAVSDAVTNHNVRSFQGTWHSFNLTTVAVLTAGCVIAGFALCVLLVRFWRRMESVGFRPGTETKKVQDAAWLSLFFWVVVFLAPVVAVHNFAAARTAFGPEVGPGRALLGGYQTDPVEHTTFWKGQNQEARIDARFGPGGARTEPEAARLALLDRYEATLPVKITSSRWSMGSGPYGTSLFIWFEPHFKNTSKVDVTVNKNRFRLLVDGDLANVKAGKDQGWSQTDRWPEGWWAATATGFSGTDSTGKPIVFAGTAPYLTGTDLVLKPGETFGSDETTNDVVTYQIPVPNNGTLTVLGAGLFDADNKMIGFTAADHWGTQASAWTEMVQPGEATWLWDVTPGSCIRMKDVPMVDESLVGVVPCGWNHDWDAVQTVVYPQPQPDAYPGTEAMAVWAHKECEKIVPFERRGTGPAPTLWVTPKDWKNQTVDHRVAVCLALPAKS